MFSGNKRIYIYVYGVIINRTYYLNRKIVVLIYFRSFKIVWFFPFLRMVLRIICSAHIYFIIRNYLFIKNVSRKVHDNKTQFCILYSNIAPVDNNYCHVVTFAKNLLYPKFSQTQSFNVPVQLLLCIGILKRLPDCLFGYTYKYIVAVRLPSFRTQKSTIIIYPNEFL